MPGAHPRRCLGPELSAYADRALAPVELRAWDRHLVSCGGCRQAVEAERRMLSSLRRAGGPEVPGDLRAMLLSLASGAGSEAAPSTPPVPVVDRCAPALHRSAVRATVCAGLAAGASAAAAWSLAVAGAPPTPPAPAVATPGTAVQRTGPAVSSFMRASLMRASLGPVVIGPRVGSAQSSP